MGREKEEWEDWGELGGVGGWRWRKSPYGSRKEDILIKGAILGLARDLSIEELPGVQGDVPSLFLEQQRKGWVPELVFSYSHNDEYLAYYHRTFIW